MAETFVAAFTQQSGKRYLWGNFKRPELPGRLRQRGHLRRRLPVAAATTSLT